MDRAVGPRISVLSSAFYNPSRRNGSLCKNSQELKLVIPNADCITQMDERPHRGFFACADLIIYPPRSAVISDRFCWGP